MKKLTTIALLIIFLLSVVVVGVFGMKNVPYESVVYTKDVVFKKVYFSNAMSADVVLQEDNVSHKVYSANIKINPLEISEESPLEVLVEYEVLPNNATNKSIEITLEERSNDGVTLITDDNTGFKKILVTKPVTFTLSYRRLDSASATPVYLEIYVRKK